jgi:hypothetical protein
VTSPGYLSRFRGPHHAFLPISAVPRRQPILAKVGAAARRKNNNGRSDTKRTVFLSGNNSQKKVNVNIVWPDAPQARIAFARARSAWHKFRALAICLSPRMLAFALKTDSSCPFPFISRFPPSLPPSCLVECPTVGKFLSYSSS